MPNIFPIIASLYIGYERGFIGIEFLLIPVILAARLNWLAIFTGLAAISLELIYGISQAYPIFETNQLLEAIQFLPEANIQYIAVILFIYIQYIIVFFIQHNSIKNKENIKKRYNLGGE